MLQVCILLCAERHWQDKGLLLSASRVSWSGQHPLDMPTTPRLTRDSTQHHSAHIPPDSGARGEAAVLDAQNSVIHLGEQSLHS